MIKKKKRNPISKLQKIAGDIVKAPVVFVGKGDTSETFKFKQNNHWLLIKILTNDYLLTKNQQRKYQLLSLKELIPKIYLITDKYIIMDFIEGEKWEDFSLKLNDIELEEFENRIYEKLDQWKKLGFKHGDLHGGNIIITPSEEIYFIDPEV